MWRCLLGTHFVCSSVWPHHHQVSVRRSLGIVFAPRFFVVMGTPRFPKSETTTRQSRSDNSNTTSFLMDSEMIKVQDKEQLRESREQALRFQEQVASLIKAIDAELDRRSRNSCVINLSGSPQSQSTKLSMGGRGERSETQLSPVLGRGERADTRTGRVDTQPNSRVDSQNNSRVDSQNEEAARVGGEKPEEVSKAAPSLLDIPRV